MKFKIGFPIFLYNFFMEKTLYTWWRDKKMLATISLIILVSMLIFGFLEIPVLSTIPRYTINMMLGFYSPLFYAFGFYWCLTVIFGNAIKLPKWVKLNGFTYWVVALSIIFLSTSLFFYQDSTGFTSIGGEPWKAFIKWFDDFRETSAWYPQNTNGGIIGVFLYSFFAMIASGIGAMIISIGALAISISIIITGSFFGFYKNLVKKQKFINRRKENKIDKEINIERHNIKSDKDREKTPHTDDKPFIDFDETQPKEKEEDDFPFEDPFK